MEDEHADRVYVPGKNAAPPPNRDVEDFWPPEEPDASTNGAPTPRGDRPTLPPQAVPAPSPPASPAFPHYPPLSDQPPFPPPQPVPLQQFPPVQPPPVAPPTAPAQSAPGVYRPADRQPVPPPNPSVTPPPVSAEPPRPPAVGQTPQPPPPTPQQPLPPRVAASTQPVTPAQPGPPSADRDADQKRFGIESPTQAWPNIKPRTPADDGPPSAATPGPHPSESPPGAGGPTAQDSPWALPPQRPAPGPVPREYDEVELQELGNPDRLPPGQGTDQPPNPVTHRAAYYPTVTPRHADDHADTAQAASSGEPGPLDQAATIYQAGPQPAPPPGPAPGPGPVPHPGPVPGPGPQYGPAREHDPRYGPVYQPPGPAPTHQPDPRVHGPQPAPGQHGPDGPRPAWAVDGQGQQWTAEQAQRWEAEQQSRQVVGPYPPAMDPRAVPPHPTLQQQQSAHPEHPPHQPIPPTHQPGPQGDPFNQQPWVSDGSAPTAEEFARRRLAKPAEPTASMGPRRLLQKGTMGLVRLAPGRKEQEYKQDVEMVRRNFGGLRQVTVVNPKGGAGKTVAVLLLAMTFGQKRGGYVLAWDNNETQGTLGMRAQQDFHARTVRDMMRDLHLFRGAQGRVGDLSQYVRAQGEGMFDVLASDESATAGEMLTASAFGEIREIVSRFYKLIFVDTGNNVRAQNWQAAMDATDQLVITMSARNDSAETAARMLDHLEQSGRQRLVRQAISVVSMPPTRKDIDYPAIERHFAARTRMVLTAPYDRLIDSGEPMRYGHLSNNTRESWLKIAAAVAEGL